MVMVEILVDIFVFIILLIYHYTSNKSKYNKIIINIKFLNIFTLINNFN